MLRHQVAVGAMAENSSDERLTLSWLVAQPSSVQEQFSKKHLQELLHDARQPRHVSGSAYIRLCYFIDQCRKSSSEVLVRLAFSEKVCFDLWSFCLEGTEKNQHRSMRQVLELLITLLVVNPNKSHAKEYKQQILEQLLAILMHEGAQPHVKPGLKALEFFLGKGVISVPNLVAVYSNKKNVNPFEGSGACDEQQLSAFVSDMFDWMTLPDTSPTAGKLLVTLFQQCRKNPDAITNQLQTSAHPTLWVRWIRDGLGKHPDALENVKIYLFPALFKIDRSSSVEFLGSLVQNVSIGSLQSEELDASSFLFLSAIEVGKKAGLVDDGNDPQAPRDPKRGTNMLSLPETALGALLSHASSAVRSSALSVLISSSSSTKPFSDKTLNILRNHLDSFHADTDAKFRNDLLSNTKHLIERLRDAMASQIRDMKHFISNKEAIQALPTQKKTVSDSTVVLSPESHLSKRLHNHKAFIRWYLRFLCHELIPTAAYQRHITALKALHVLLKSDIKLYMAENDTSRTPAFSIFTRASVRLLMDLILDPFEDVRSTAIAVLKMAPVECFQFSRLGGGAATAGEEPKLLQDFIARAEEASIRTSRADMADGVAHSQELLFRLTASNEGQLQQVESVISSMEKKITVAELDLGKAVSAAPLHAQFATLRLIWDAIPYTNLPSDWKSLQRRIIVCCCRIWTSVRTVLCNDSPEGHFPSDFEDSDTIDTKDILSYSFRAIHESSNLMRAIVSKLGSTLIDGSSLLLFEDFRIIGNLSYDQLASLRHRGAFSTVSLTFAKCCQLTQAKLMPDQGGVTLLKEWYNGAMACIHEQTSTTRRSAGIPALMTGILSAGSSSPAFSDVLEDLKSLAGKPVFLSEIDETNLPQVHAMNCLKEIFKSSILGKRADSHLAECLQLAADSLQSEVWAIRNCGLILLRSLIDSLFGTSESKAVAEAGWDGRSVRLSYEKYSALPEILLNLLRVDTESLSFKTPTIGTVESVFPALDIIRRAGPPEMRRDEIYHCVLSHLGSNVWHVRDIASRTIATLLLHNNWLADALELLESCTNSLNRQHGTLLSLKYVLERHLDLDSVNIISSFDIISSKLESNVTIRQNLDACPELEAAYENVRNVIFRANIKFDASNQYPVHSLVPQMSTSENAASSRHVSERVCQLILTTGMLSVEAGVDSSAYKRKLSSALLKQTLTLQVLYMTASTGVWTELIAVGDVSARGDPDTALCLLENLPLVWKTSKASLEEHLGIARLYVAVLGASPPTQLRALCLDGLASVLDYLSAHQQKEQPELMAIIKHYASSMGPKSPELINAEMRISGCVLRYDLHMHDMFDDYKSCERVQAWGDILGSAIEAENDFDLRLSAAEALRSFYTASIVAKIIETPHPSFLPSLLALYDALNDDDDDIRGVGAETMHFILERRLEPFAAREQLLEWLRKVFGDSTYFHDAFCLRVKGIREESSRSIEDQLEEALIEDDALFVEEEQNLYVDEVREFAQWNALLVRSIAPAWTTTALGLSDWAIEALTSVRRLCDVENGLLGKLSKPRVFAICMGVVQATVALVTHFRTILERNEGDRGGIKMHNAAQVDNFATTVEEKLQSLEKTARSVVDTQSELHPLLLLELQECVQ